MSAIDRKLLRDLWHLRGQVAAIAAVIGAGVAMYIMMLSAFDSLDYTRSTYYERQRFGEVFASLKRAPLRLADRIEAIPGVARVQTRVVVDVTLDVPGLAEPAVGRLISIPDAGMPALNVPVLRGGRWPDAGAGGDDQAVVSETFADVHGLQFGDTVTALINGRRRELTVVGTALSPEYIYGIRPGDVLPDDRRFGQFWVRRKGLAAAFDMEGGFNDVSLDLRPGTNPDAVIDRLDPLLEVYGGPGAIPRARQTSHWFLENELASLRSMGRMIPLVFLGVAAFLLNVVMTRLVALQREQIAALKALGYGDRSIALHYVKWGLSVAVAGSLAGVAAGAWVGSGMTAIYAEFYHFPILHYRLLPGTALEASSVSLVAAVVGALGAVKRAVRLPPAEAMRPEPPERYRETWIERAGFRRFLRPPTRMILRNLQRRPMRAALSVTGISAGAALLIVGSFSYDSVEVLLDLQFAQAQRQDVTLTFVEPASSRAEHEVARLPGVLQSEPFRAIPVRIVRGAVERQTSIRGVAAGASLERIVDASGRAIEPPPDGLLLSRKLADVLRARPGDVVRVEVLEGRRPTLELPVAGTVEEYIGLGAYMALDALHAAMRESDVLSGAALRVDRRELDALYARVKRTPRIAALTLKQAAVDGFNETIGQSIGTVRFFNVLFAGIIAFGVVYNSARISLSERGRELATLRVLGFTRREIAFILLGELAVLTLISIPIGLVLGRLLSQLAGLAFDTELFRIPVIVLPRTYATAGLTVAGAAVLSGLAVRRRLNRLDLIAVLKTRE